MKKNVSLLIFLGLGLVLFWGNPEDRIKKSHFLSSSIFYPFTISIEQIQNYSHLKKENETLRQKLIQTQLMEEKLRIQLKKSEFYQSSLPIINHSFLLADIVGRGGTIERATLLINKGSSSEIHENDPVISISGLVGKINQVTPHQAMVLPYHHHTFQAAVMTKKSNIQGILQSDIEGNSSMNFLRFDDEISIGDTIVTSHLSTIFPQGILVGKVTKIINSEDKVHKSAILKRFCKPERLAQVAIIQKGKTDEK